MLWTPARPDSLVAARPTNRATCDPLPMANHKRKRPKHHRGGCLLCKPQKLTANVKAQRRRDHRTWVQAERSASQDA